MSGFDQALHLRSSVMRRQEMQKRPLCAQVYCISSGKGGVGKSNLAINIGISLARAGKKTLVIDADLGLANLEILLGLSPAYSLMDITDQALAIEQVIAQGPGGVDIISGGSGLEHLQSVSGFAVQNLFEAFASLEDRYQYILIDTGAGISASVTAFIEACENLWVVSTCEPTSIADAYSLIKTVALRDPSKKISFLVNRASCEQEAVQVFQNMQSVVWRFLKIRIEWAGFVRDDKHVSRAVREQVPFVLRFPNSPGALDIDRLTQRLLGIYPASAGTNSFFGKLKKLVLGKEKGDATTPPLT